MIIAKCCSWLQWTEPWAWIWRLLVVLLGQGRRGSEGPGGLGSGEKGGGRKELF